MGMMREKVQAEGGRGFSGQPEAMVDRCNDGRASMDERLSRPA
jgi:hypothetical protein